VRGGSPYPPRMGEIAVFGAVGAETHRAKCGVEQAEYNLVACGLMAPPQIIVRA